MRELFLSRQCMSHIFQGLKIFKANDALVYQMPRTRLFCGWANLNQFEMYKVQILTNIQQKDMNMIAFRV